MKFSIDLPKSYEPEKFESNIYSWWEDNLLFNPDTQTELKLTTSRSKRFCLTLPPPNVTGALHLGHALTISIEDLMVRYERMRQKQTLFLPGSDHAGIATQNVVERELKKQGINRKELGREKFVEEVWKWKHQYHKRITEQSKSLGMSADWSRERFTLDENLSLAVRTAFVRLFKKGLIYRGDYLVNWCPGRCESAISDLESIPEEVKSHLWYIKYPILSETFSGPEEEWGSGTWAQGATEFIEVATTRPETLLGDTAIATHKKHKIFGKLIGKKVIVPVNGRIINIIEDSHVDPEFGTGAVKVTPAHDPNDYEIGKRHNLEFIAVMDKQAKMVPEYSGKYANMDRFKARKALVEDLKKEGLLVKIEDYTHSVGHCERCHTVIEQMISTQWFVKTKTLAEAAMGRVNVRQTVIYPERERKRFIQWMENIRDWCISRQLWWGHRIPVWYCEKGHQTSELEDPETCSSCGSKNLTQDEDVLDTWFSSGLWPFSTLGWPNTEHPDYVRYFSTDMRETGYDILFFWVAREMMLAIELTGKVPYKTVYFHGLIRNESGKKISKSMENIEDYNPLKIIKKHGTDSLRFTLISNAVPGLDINMDLRQLDAAHRFCNKIWQSTKFVMMQVKENEKIPKFSVRLVKKLHITDKWIISKLNRLLSNVQSYMDNYEYLKVAREIKSFYWNDFCDWYIEVSKNRIYQSDEIIDELHDPKIPKIVLFHVLETCLKLLHPIIPYMTEVLWQALPDSIKSDKALIVAKWPKSKNSLIFSLEETNTNFIFSMITEIRKVRAEFNIPLNVKIPLVMNADKHYSLINTLKPELISLAKLDEKKLELESPRIPENSARIIVKDLTLFIPLADVIDKEAEFNRINTQVKNIEKIIVGIKKKLAGPFVSRAKPEIVEKEKKRLSNNESKLDLLLEQLNILK